MVKLFVGHKGSGKTKKMVQLANDMVENSHGSIVYISKNNRLTYDLKYKIRVVCMEEYEYVTNIDEYTGFIYGIISSDHDIEVIFIDGILHYEDVHIPDLKEFFARLNKISDLHNLDFVVSVSANLDELGDSIEGCEILS
ncbi:MAG: hypothetical protein ACOX4P_02435 [Anaerovoracaceae bacterium]|jgi:thymidine kinase